MVILRLKDEIKMVFITLPSGRFEKIKERYYRITEILVAEGLKGSKRSKILLQQYQQVLKLKRFENNEGITTSDVE